MRERESGERERDRERERQREREGGREGERERERGEKMERFEGCPNLHNSMHASLL